MRERNLDGSGLDLQPTSNPKREGNGFDIEATSNPIPVPTCLHARFLPGWQSILVIQDLRPLVSSRHLDKEVKAASCNSCLGSTGIFVATLVKYQRSKGRCWLLGKNPCCWTSVGKDWDVLKAKALHYFPNISDLCLSNCWWRVFIHFTFPQGEGQRWPWKYSESLAMPSGWFLSKITKIKDMEYGDLFGAAVDV